YTTLFRSADVATLLLRSLTPLARLRPERLGESTRLAEVVREMLHDLRSEGATADRLLRACAQAPALEAAAPSLAPQPQAAAQEAEAAYWYDALRLALRRAAAPL